MTTPKHLLSIIALGFLLLACKVSVSSGAGPTPSAAPAGKATVDCLGTAAGINCDVKQTEGARPLNVCWDLRFDCANGTVSEGKGLCQDVEPGKTARKVVPLTALSNSAKCDQVVESKVLNLAITAR
jgi:hypothetical protein